MRVGLRSLTAGLLGVVAAMAALPVRADVIVTGIPTFGGGKENVAATLRVLDAIDPSIVYLGKFRETGAVSGTVNSTTGSILFYDVQAGRHSDLVQLGTPGENVGWTTDWSNLTKKGKFRNASYIAIFGVATR